MTDNLNGTYTAKFKTEGNLGKITVVVYKQRTTYGGTNTYIYPEADFKGTPSFSANTDTSISKYRVKTNGPLSGRQYCYYKTASSSTVNLHYYVEKG